MKTFIIIFLLIVLTIICVIAAFLNRKTAKELKTVGKIIVNVSNPETEYFTCQLYSKEFFALIHQKEKVVFDVEVK